jgi:hypothetical protein
MGLEVEKKRKHEPLIIKISDYDSIELVLSDLIVPFSEVLKSSNQPDIYSGHERIPFEKRDPFYKSMMREEFADAMRTVQTIG